MSEYAFSLNHISNWFQLIINNFKFYSKAISSLADSQYAMYSVAGILLGGILMVLFFLGSVTAPTRTIDICLLVYIFSILLWRVHDERFLFPIWPWVFLKIYHGANVLASAFLMQRIKKAMLLFLFIYIINQIPMLIYYYGVRNNSVDGPYYPSLDETKNYLQSKIPPHSVVAFCKPRAMALITQRPFTQFSANLDVNNNIASMKALHVGYLLGYSDKRMKEIDTIIHHTTSFISIDSSYIKPYFELYTLHWK